ncbi:MAG: hypothetical protein PHU25_14995 [Deltaproteobacteria bacterium]|nr:hypothetical protein [Deltaproteobacteria bacterium]
MTQLHAAIENAATAFSARIVALVQGATFGEISALHVGTTKAKTGRKPGRPKAATTAAKSEANKMRSLNYPKCSVPGCGKNRYAKGNGMCGEHFRAKQATGQGKTKKRGKK